MESRRPTNKQTNQPTNKPEIPPGQENDKQPAANSQKPETPPGQAEPPPSYQPPAASQRPETPPGQTETPPGQVEAGKPEVPPGLVENPGQAEPAPSQKPETPPGQEKTDKPETSPSEGRHSPQRHDSPQSPGSQGKGKGKGKGKGQNPFQGQPKGNEGVGQTPDHSQKESAAKIQIFKDVLGTYTYDEAKKEYVRYKPEEQQRTGGGGGKRWMAVPQGGFIKYVIEVRNNGEAPVSDLVVWDMIPSKTSYLPGETILPEGLGVEEKATDKRITWKFGSDLSAESSAFFTFMFKVDDNAPINHVITNVAKTNYGPAAECQVRVVAAKPAPPGQVTPSPDQVGPQGPPGAAGPAGPPGPPGPAAYGVEFIKSVSQTFAQPSSILEYTLYVENTGGQEFLNVEIRDDIPAGTIYRSDSATGGATLSGNTLIWKISSLRPGERYEFKFQVIIEATARGVIRNVAYFTSQDPATQRMRAVETVILLPVAYVSPMAVQPTPAVLILPAPKAVRAWAKGLPYTGFDFLILYLALAMSLIGSGLVLQRLKD